MSQVALSMLCAVLLGLGPFEKNDPLIEEGTELYEQGKYDEALAKFDQAGLQHPQDARVAYNRGLALHKAGRNEEAKQALERALELDRAGQGTLAAKSHYNLGNVAAALEDSPRAVREYREALKRDPGDELARHNLEVVLRKLPPRQAGSDGGAPDPGESDGGRPDGGRPDGGAPDAGGRDAGAHDGGAPDGGSDGGARGDGGAGDGGRGDGGEGQQERGDAGRPGGGSPGDGGADGGEQGSDGGAPTPARAGRLQDGGVDVSKQQAEQLLDSMKNSEKNMQLWRFRQKTQKIDPHAKDW
jgi:tetratricopeptide (TPR) repeat protein